MVVKMQKGVVMKFGSLSPGTKFVESSWPAQGAGPAPICMKLNGVMYAVEDPGGNEVNLLGKLPICRAVNLTNGRPLNMFDDAEVTPIVI
jgi:hypothetical protein